MTNWMIIDEQPQQEHEQRWEMSMVVIDEQLQPYNRDEHYGH